MQCSTCWSRLQQYDSWLRFNGTFSTTRLDHAFKSYSLVKRLRRKQEYGCERKVQSGQQTKINWTTVIHNTHAHLRLLCANMHWHTALACISRSLVATLTTEEEIIMKPPAIATTIFTYAIQQCNCIKYIKDKNTNMADTIRSTSTWITSENQQ